MYVSNFKQGEYSSKEKKAFLKSAVIYGYPNIVDMLLTNGVKPAYTKYAIAYPSQDAKGQASRQKVAAVFRKHGVKVGKPSATYMKRYNKYKTSAKRKSPRRKASPKRKSPQRKASPKRKSPKRKASPKSKSPQRKASPKRNRHSPSIIKKRVARPSPSSSAAETRIGTVRKGNDGNYWIVRKSSTGVKRWVKY
jgi:hypothetical protein